MPNTPDRNRYPSIPQPQPGHPDSVLAAVHALKRGFEMLLGQGTVAANQAVTYGNLVGALTSVLPTVPGLVGATGAQGKQGLFIPGRDGDDGAPGIPGRPGIQGPPGLFIRGRDGDDGDTVIVPGPPGTPGLPGLFMRGYDGEDGEPATLVPGPAGPAGANGVDGAPGTGPATYFFAYDGEDGEPGPMIPGPPGAAGPTGAAGGSTDQLLALAATTSYANDATAQSIFSATFTLAADTTYRFQMLLVLSISATVNSCIASIGFTGTGVATFVCDVHAYNGATDTLITANSNLLDTQPLSGVYTAVEAANSSSRRVIRVDGVIRSNGSGGTIDPKFKFNTAPSTSAVNGLVGTFAKLSVLP